MLSTTEKGTSQRGKGNPVMPLTGLRADVVQSLEADFPGALSQEMRWLLGQSCGLIADEFGSIDFTSRWHPQESLEVFRPCLTLALDDDGRRWIAETSRGEGLPGPVWCVFSEPAVAVYVSDELTGFVTMVNEGARLGCTSKWLRSLAQEARIVWGNRGPLARKSREQCREDVRLRGWLAGLPVNASIYDLRAPSPTRGWPYGLAGPEGRLYRCGRLPVFAVAAAPTAGQWTPHTVQGNQQPSSLLHPLPASTKSLRGSS